MKLEFIPIELIDHNPFQKAEYQDSEKVQEIAASLEQNLANGTGTNGLLQVPTARKVNGRYQLAFGHHRHQAFVYLANVKGMGAFQKMPLFIDDLTDLQMFEAMAEENIQRRDISFIEEAEVYSTYMTSFGKTSVQAAERFGKSEEHIRNRVMLLQLPESAKEKARKGELNVSMARDLVSARKLIGDAGVEDAIEDIQSEIFDTPREAVLEAIKASDNTREFDSQHKPWMDEKKFPVKHLEKLSHKAVELALALDDDKSFHKEIHQLVEALNTGQEIDAQALPFKKEELERARLLANPPACTACPLHTIFDGDHFCGLKACFERKEKAWAKAKVEALWKDLGIPLYVNEATDGKCVELSRWDSADQKLFKERHADLRLRPTTRQIWNNFDCLPHNVSLVAVGKTAEKRLTKVEEKEQEDRKESESRQLKQAKMELINEHVFRFAWTVMTPAFEALLDGMTNLPFALFLLEETIYFHAEFPEEVPDQEEQIQQIRGLHNGKKKPEALKHMRRLIVSEAVWHAMDWNRYQNQPAKPILEVAKRLQAKAEEWGYKLPKTWSATAEKYQAELEAALKTLQKEFKQKTGDSK